MSLAPVNDCTPALPAQGRFDEGQLAVLRRTIAADLTEDEFALFGQVCQRTGLDPFARQIWAIKRRSKKRVNNNGRWEDVWEEHLTIQTGIDGYRLIAERSGHYRGQTEPEWCGPDGQWVSIWLSTEPPAAARVGVLRDDFAVPVMGVAMFDEFAATTGQGADKKLTGQWRTMPAHMIAKCAEALAIRKAFPNDVYGIYTVEEMGQADNVRPIDTGGREGISERDFDEIREAAATLTDEQRGELHAWCVAEGIEVARARLTSDGAGRVLQRILDLARGAVDVPSEGPATSTSSSPVSHVDGGTPAGVPGDAGHSSAGAVPSSAATDPVSVPPVDTDDDTGGESARTAPSGAVTTLKEANPSGYNSLVRYCRKMKAEHFSPDEATSKAQWEALAWASSGGRTTQVRDLTPEEAGVFRGRIGDLANGLGRWVESDDPKFLGWTIQIVEEL